MTGEVKKPLSIRMRRMLLLADANKASHAEKWLSAFGGFAGILVVLWISREVLDLQGAAMVVGSMGASAVLLFAVPHGALSQPWPVLGGHLVSAVIGVTCAQHIAGPMLAAAVAVGLAIGAMYYLHCIHPPGGATALVAVLGGDAVHQLGYGFVLSPVLENVVIILLMATLVNLPFRHRRYPAALSRPDRAPEISGEKAPIAHADLVFALSQLDSFIDVSEQDLVRIYTLAVHHSHKPVPCHIRGEECNKKQQECLCQALQSAESQVSV